MPLLPFDAKPLYCQEISCDSYQNNPAGYLFDCLQECYGVDGATADCIIDKLSPLFEYGDYNEVISNFIEQSYALNLFAYCPVEVEGEICDALQKFPSCHTVLFDSPYVRILWAHTRSGEQEPPQVHPWKSMMIIVQPSQFSSQNCDGTFFEDDWPVGLYLLDPWMFPSACKNIGFADYMGLVFEIKQPPRCW